MKKIALVLVFATVLCCFVGCGSTFKPKELTIEGVQNICNLATLECHYNNVARDVKTGEGWSSFFEKDRQYWVEYTGTVKLGVKMDEVKMWVDGTTVKVYVPDAVMLSEPIIPDNSIKSEKVIVEKDGLIFKNPITDEFEKALYSEAMTHMKETVQNDTSTLNRAHKRAQTLIKNYIEELGRLADIEYEVVWVNADGNEIE